MQCVVPNFTTCAYASTTSKTTGKLVTVWLIVIWDTSIIMTLIVLRSRNNNLTITVTVLRFQPLFPVSYALESILKTTAKI